jgi:hypothetical protein
MPHRYITIASIKSKKCTFRQIMHNLSPAKKTYSPIVKAAL